MQFILLCPLYRMHDEKFNSALINKYSIGKLIIVHSIKHINKLICSSGKRNVQYLILLLFMHTIGLFREQKTPCVYAGSECILKPHA